MISAWRGLCGVETPMNGTPAALRAAGIVDCIAEIPELLVRIVLLDQLQTIGRGLGIGDQLIGDERIEFDGIAAWRSRASCRLRIWRGR